MMIRIRADFNGIIGDILCLSHQDTSQDENGSVITFKAGMHLTAYDEDPDIDGTPDELIAIGIVEPAPDWLACKGSRWVLQIDQDGVRHKSECE